MVQTRAGWLPDRQKMLVPQGSAFGKCSTYLVLIVRLAVVGGTNSEDDDHDQQSSARGQDGYQGFVIRRFL